MTRPTSVLPARPLRRLALVPVLVLGAWLGLASGSASAKVVHPFLSSFDGSGTPAGSFFAAGVAVDNSSGPNAGDVYVSDAGNSVVDKFSYSSSTLTATYVCQITGAGSASTSASECDKVNVPPITGDPGVPGGSFASAYAQNAVDSNGNVYVGDVSGSAVDEFGPSGKFLSPQITVPNGGQPWAVALNPAGDLLIVDEANNRIDEYDPSTSSMSTFATGTPSGAFGGVSGVAVDEDPSSPAYGDVYAADNTNRVVDVFSSSGAYLSQLTGTPSGAFPSAVDVAVDPASGDLYVVDDTSDVDEFGPTGTFVSQIPLPNNGAPFSVAISATTGDVYVADLNNGVVDVFGPGEFVPDVTTGQATNVQPTSATLNGTVNPHGMPLLSPPKGCYFEYVDQADYHPSASDPYSAGQTAACSSTPSGSSPTDVSAAISGLTPGTAYHFRLVAANANGADQGSDQTFGPPVIDSQSATGLATTATLTAQINPFGIDTTCRVQYVDDANYRSSGYADATTLPCSPSDLGSASGDQTATAALTGLALDTTYHHRFIATNSAAPNGVVGPDQTFQTFGIKTASVQTVDQNGNPYTQAGGHPYELNTDIQFNATQTNSGAESPAANFRDLSVDLPPGLIGNPTATPTCKSADLISLQCSGAAQVGTVDLTSSVTGFVPHTYPLYNIVPPPGVPARFSFYVDGGITGHIDASVRTGGDYGITAGGLRINPDAGITAIEVTMWGVPADPSHNANRYCPSSIPGQEEQPSCSSGAPLVPFLTDPTSCSGPVSATVSTDSWQDPGAFTTATTTMPGFTGCNDLNFNPSITVQPDTSVADSPSGLSVDLSMPQDGLLNPTGLAEANLKDATVALPQGVSVNPSAANGLTACTPDQIGIDNANEPSCPDSSKIGSVEVDTPLLSMPLTGGVYVAQENNNPFNSLLAIYVTAEADGVLVKLAGHVVANPVTGQLETTFSNNPQLPFTDFKLDFFGGPHGVLATPESCGTFTTASDLSSWAGGPDVTSSDSFPVTSGCVSGFAPTFTAGTQNAQAGSYSPFVLSFSRGDTDQNFSGLSVQLPPGILARLAGVQECTDAQLAAAAASSGAAEQASPSCPAGSQVGTVETGAGTGPDPYFISGQAYLTGPYNGAPYGLAVVVPAVAGPYDLGTVVVRQALYIDPTTAQVTAVSDPFPTILDGIPLRIRSISVDLNRPGFTVAPTSCNPMAVTGTLSSTGGLTYTGNSRFQVGGCSSLAFSPKLKIALSGKGKTRSGDHPTLTATLTDAAGQANIRSAKVTLPLSLALDDSQNHPHPVCNYYVAQAVHGGAVGCPANTVVGSASVTTPLLSGPLTGPVYFVQGIRFNAQGQPIHTLPSLLIPLRGQIALDLRAQSATNGAGALVTTFSTIPDAPVSKFTLKINGGPKGILVITGRGRSICGKAQVSKASFGAQSGKAMSSQVRMSTPCAAVKHKKKTKGKRGKSRSSRGAVRGLAVDRLGR